MSISDTKGVSLGRPRASFWSHFGDVLAASGPVGAPDTEKYDLGSIWVVFWGALGVFWGTLGMFFRTFVVGMRLCGHRVFKVASHVMLRGIPLCFSTLKSNSPHARKLTVHKSDPQVQAGMGFS